ncbi:unnamed protein product [Merluccius merluccius]
MWALSVCVAAAAAAAALLSGRYRVRMAALYRGAAARLLRWAGGGACARKTHAFVFSQCTHGRADSVLATFDLYAESHHTLTLGPHRGPPGLTLSPRRSAWESAAERTESGAVGPQLQFWWLRSAARRRGDRRRRVPTPGSP